MKCLNRTHLKLIAICAMICDHVAWGFLDFMNPVAQFLHVIGRLTIPIMCFFIAEGFRKTTNLKAYIQRMLSFWLISAIPFYLFFHEEYGYRQNILFDLLLGIFALYILTSQKLRKLQKALLCLPLFVLSFLIGGWPIMPMLYICIFYFGKDFKTQAKYFCMATVALVVFLGIAVELNQIWHFSSYDWHWYEKLYFLGFMLSLPLLSAYNGEKGKEPLGKYFFYIFYPAHFLILYGIQHVEAYLTFTNIYISSQVLAVILLLLMIARVAFVKPSVAQTSFLLLASSALVYSYGFLIEITSTTVEGVYAAIKIEYLGECLLIIAFTWFIKDFCHKEIPKYVYSFEGIVSVLTLWAIFSFEKNHLFYTEMYMDFSGPLPRIHIEYGIGFYLFLVYLAIICCTSQFMMLYEIVNLRGVARKRMICMFISPICVWAPYFIRELGLTGGYEVPSLGIVAATALIALSVLRYCYFDSIHVAKENALNHGKEGLLVIDLNQRVLFFNKRIKKLFDNVSENMDINQHTVLKEIFNGKIKSQKIGNILYEMRIEPLKESGLTMGYMLWVIDMTEHYYKLNQISESARKDDLTGINKRDYYAAEVSNYISQKRPGTMFMLDLDNFKSINDTFGHQAGDVVLSLFAETIKEVAEDSNFICRMGGDEFSMFFKDIVEREHLAKIADQIIRTYKNNLSDTPYSQITTTSIGIAVFNPELEEFNVDFKELYNRADKALYLSKNNGKNCYHFY